jgi:hypothetical protein
LIYDLHTEIQELVKSYGPPLVASNNLPVYNAAFLVELINLAVKKGLEYAVSPKQEECDKEYITMYGNGNMETVMLIIGLSCLSWLSFNIKRKTEEGRCLNPRHDQKDEHPYCLIGKAFHRKLYDNLLKIMEQIINSIGINIAQNST